MMNPIRRQRWGWGMLVTISTTFLLLMTLRPTRNRVIETINFQPFFYKQWAMSCLGDSNCPQHINALIYLSIDVVGNVVVFIPFGLGLAGLIHTIFPGRAVWLAVLGGLLLSLTIEVAQLIIPSRTTDIDDIILNSVGTLIGVVGFIFLQRIINHYE